MAEYPKIRHNNHHLYFEGDEEKRFIVLEEKEYTVNPFIPNNITLEERNGVFNSILTNYVVLNPTITFAYLFKVAKTINENCLVPYDNFYLIRLCGKLIKKGKAGELDTFENQERRIIFNPDATFDKKEKQKISGMVTSKLRADKTLSEIYETMEGWDFETNGKLTIDKLSEVIGKSSRTVKRHMKKHPDLKESMKEYNTKHINNAEHIK